MQKILMSACLMGAKVRYDGRDCLQDHPAVQRWFKEGRVVSICPEMAGGLSTPRPPAEQRNGLVFTDTGEDVTREFHKGAEQALELCKKHDIRFALLKARSPSCGNEIIYDGTFTSTRIPGQGVTAALLSRHGIRVFNEDQIDELVKALGIKNGVDLDSILDEHQKPHDNPVSFK